MSTASKYLAADERRAMTVASVLALAAECNPAEITTSAIAARMGLSQAAVFRHFPTKDAIWRAVMDWVAEDLLRRIEQAARAAASPMAALEAVFHAHVNFALEYPGVPRMLFGELQRTESTPAKEAVADLLRRYGQLLTALLEQGRAAREVRADLAAPVAVSMFVGTIQGLIMQSLLTGDMERMRVLAPESFALYRRAIERMP